MSLIGALMVAGWLTVLVVVFNLVLARRLDGDVNTILRARAAAAAATVTVSSNGHMSVEERDDDVLDTGIWFYDRRRAIERPPGGAQVQAEADLLAGRSTFADRGQIRFYARPIDDRGRRIGTVVTSTSTAPYRRTRSEALFGSAALAALTLAGVYVALRLTTAHALRPVGIMTRQAAEWSVSHLTERFGPDQRFAELQMLADTLNGLLDRLTASVRHERRLTAELSHELRTPLTTIVTAVDLLLAHSHTQSEIRQAHIQVRETAMAMDRILETLLTAGRVQIAGIEGRCRVIDAVQRLLEYRQNDHRATPTYRVDIPEDLIAGVESAVVERILAPLVDNAERFAKSTVFLKGIHIANSVVLDVGDDGPGVRPENAVAIFEPGVQFGEHVGHGAGLGLPLSRRLARAASGDVWHQHGSRFRVKLPRA